MTSIENREIKGITNKIVVTVIISVVTITSGGMLFYAGLMSKIDAVTSMQESRKVEVDLQLNAINDKVGAVKDDVKDLKEDIKDIRSKNN